LLGKKQNLSNQLDSLKDTNSRLIDYVKLINTKVGTANSGKEFSEISLSRLTYAPGIFPGILSK
jgi:hypothetical protein